MIALYVFIFIISCYFLVSSGSRIIKGLVEIARYLEWKEFMVASLLMAFATSLPELFVSISAALHKKPELALGNILGSNIIVLTLVMGIGTLIAKTLKFKGKILQRASLYACFSASLPLILMLDYKISRLDGVILLFSAFFYFYWLLSQKEKFSKIIFDKIKQKDGFLLFLKSLAGFALGVFLLLIASEGIVWSASKIAIELNLPLLMIGMFLIALGTSIPEIVFGIKSVNTGHKEMIIGDSIGSVVANSSFILGLTVLISPIEILDFTPYFSIIFFTVMTAFLFVLFARTDREISRKEAIALLFIYILFIVTESFIR